MSNQFQEYTYYLDSHNKEQKAITNEPDCNPTNDIIIPCRFPDRLAAAQITLGSLELPLTQYNIEKDWQTLYFDEGIDLYVMDVGQEALVQFTIVENGTSFTAQLPPRLNPIISITPLSSSTETAVFTTQFPHALGLSGFFNWGEPMKLINTPLYDSSVNELTPTNTSLTILSPTEFQLTWTTGAVTFEPNEFGVLGYVSTPSIPSPTYLASLVTLALNQVMPSHWNVSYDPVCGKYKLCFVGTVCNINNLSPCTLIIPGTNSLPHIMGFGGVNLNLPLPIDGGFGSSSVTFYENPNSPAALILASQPRLLPDKVQPDCVQSIECSPCRSQVQIDVGNYNPEYLMNNLSRQLNRFWFDPGCNLSGTGGAVTTSSAINFIYSTSCGLCYTIVLPFGLYNPTTLSAFLQSQMAVNISGLEVSCNLDTGQFTFSAPGNFGLEFDVSNNELVFRLGFYPLSYRNNNTYSSNIPFYYPTKGCCGTTIPDRQLSYVYSPIVNGNQRKFIVEISKPRSINNVGAITSNGNGTINVTTQLQLSPAVYIAHGFQVLDVVAVTVGGVVYELTVTAVLAYNELTLELGSISPSVFVGQEVCLELSNAIATNLYFTCVGNNILNMVLGYNSCDALWNSQIPTTWIPPSCYALNWPSYLLFEITQPYGSTRNFHGWKDSPNHTDIIPTILGKVNLYPEFKLERSFPLHMNIPDLRVIEQVKVRLLNPNHTLYQLHGRDWSFTLVFVAAQKTGQLGCM